MAVTKKLTKSIPHVKSSKVIFLASDDSSYITAQTININGGLYF